MAYRNINAEEEAFDPRNTVEVWGKELSFKEFIAYIDGGLFKIKEDDVKRVAFIFKEELPEMYERMLKRKSEKMIMPSLYNALEKLALLSYKKEIYWLFVRLRGEGLIQLPSSLNSIGEEIYKASVERVGFILETLGLGEKSIGGEKEDKKVIEIANKEKEEANEQKTEGDEKKKVLVDENSVDPRILESLGLLSFNTPKELSEEDISEALDMLLSSDIIESNELISVTLDVDLDRIYRSVNNFAFKEEVKKIGEKLDAAQGLAPVGVLPIGVEDKRILLLALFSRNASWKRDVEITPLTFEFLRESIGALGRYSKKPVGKSAFINLGEKDLEKALLIGGPAILRWISERTLNPSLEENVDEKAFSQFMFPFALNPQNGELWYVQLSFKALCRVSTSWEMLASVEKNPAISQRLNLAGFGKLKPLLNYGEDIFRSMKELLGERRYPCPREENKKKRKGNIKSGKAKEALRF